MLCCALFYVFLLFFNVWVNGLSWGPLLGPLPPLGSLTLDSFLCGGPWSTGGSVTRNDGSDSTVKAREWDRIIAVLKELYGCTEANVALQEAKILSSNKRGRSCRNYLWLLWASWYPWNSMCPVNLQMLKNCSKSICQTCPRLCSPLSAKTVCAPPASSKLLEVRSEAIRWECEGLPGVSRGQSYSIPTVFRTQYAVHSSHNVANSPHGSEVREMLKYHQEQLN